VKQRKGIGGLVLACAILAAVAWVGLRGGGEEESGLTLEQRYLLDDRIQRLVYDCPFGRTFDAQTADMIPVLVSKLERGTRDPLRMAKQDLGRIGEPAVGELTRLFERCYQERFKHAVLENILGACTLMEGPWALGIMRRAMGHVQPTVRLAALPGIENHGDAGDYDLVRQWLPLAGEGKLMAKYAACLEALDPPRYFEDLVTWFESGHYSAMWPYVALTAGHCDDPDTAQRLKATAALRDEALVPFLIAAAAKLGDADAMADLQGRLLHERPGVRQHAIQALEVIDHGLDVAALIDDEHPGVRRMAIGVLIAIEGEESMEWLREAQEDSVQQIREMVMEELVLRGDPGAVARALELLDGNVIERGVGIRALRAAWAVNPDSRHQAFERLVRAFERARDGSDQERISILQALSHVALLEAAEYLLMFADQFEGEIKGRDAHRWICGQVWNTGPMGRDLLRDRLVTETDPFRRLDLIEYIWQDHSDASREMLLALLMDETIDPHERLFCADRLTVMGPASRVAPAMKRAYLGSTHRTLRPALQCILWDWYGQHF